MIYPLHTTTTTTTTITATATTTTTAHNKLKCICYIHKLNYWWFWKYIIPFASRHSGVHRQTRVGRKQQMFHCHKFPNQKEIFLPVAYIALKWDSIEVYLQSFKFQQPFLPNFFFLFGLHAAMKSLSRA